MDIMKWMLLLGGVSGFAYAYYAYGQPTTVSRQYQAAIGPTQPGSLWDSVRSEVKVLASTLPVKQGTDEIRFRTTTAQAEADMEAARQDAIAGLW